MLNQEDCKDPEYLLLIKIIIKWVLPGKLGIPVTTVSLVE